MKGKWFFNIFGAVGAGALLIGAGIWFQQSLHNGAMDVMRPVAGAADSTRRFLESITSAIGGVPYQAEDVRRLQVENSVLKARISLLDAVEKENTILRDALGREQETLQLVAARVLGRSAGVLEGHMLIDVGTKQGIEPGMRVLVGEAIYIGTVVNASSRTATVRLLSHAGQQSPVYIPDAGISSTIKGEGLGVLSMQVPAAIDIREGEPILNAGPPDFLIGYVEKIEKSDAGSFQIVRTSHPVALSDLRHVFIVTPVTNEGG